MERIMAQGTSQTRDRIGDTAADLKEKANEQLDKMTDRVESAAKTVRDQGREMGEHVQVVADNFASALNKSIKDQPLATLALTAAVGFVLGALWKR